MGELPARTETTTRSHVTDLLRRLPQGDERAREELARFLYDELRARAAAQMRSERPDHTLQPTALANEAWIRLVENDRVRVHDRVHFFALAANCLRRILVDHARRHGAAKRGGQAMRVDMEFAAQPIVEGASRFIDLDRALTRLGQLDERKAKVVEMRFFGGLAVRDVAALLDISVATVERDLRMAKAWLHRELGADAEP